jgi:hypothetical protein
LFSLRVVNLWKNGSQRGFLDGHWVACFWSSSRSTRWPDKRSGNTSDAVSGGVMSKTETNEWNLLKQQFDALVHDESSSESIEEIFDVEFRRRFAELINQTAQRNNATGYIDWSRS